MCVSVCIYIYIKHAVYQCPDASDVHASGTGHLQSNILVVGPMFSPGKPIRRTATEMLSKDVVVGEDHLLGPSCNRYD